MPNGCPKLWTRQTKLEGVRERARVMTEACLTRPIPVTTTALPAAPAANKTAFAVIFAVAACHLINDIMQSLLSAIYPILKATYGLDFVQIGLLTFTFQVTASLLQPVIGIYTDKRPLPYSIAAGMGSTLAGLIVLGFAGDYWLLLVGSALIGFGSAVFHPESSRVARLASGGRHAFAQSTFQVGGNASACSRTTITPFFSDALRARPSAVATDRPFVD